MIYTLCSVGADLKWQLDDMGKDYTQIEDYELFYSVLARGFDVEKTKILFGDVIDFSKMQLMYNKQLDLFEDKKHIFCITVSSNLSGSYNSAMLAKLGMIDTAKELNANGRSSVVWMNILKTLDFICPELILLSISAAGTFRIESANEIFS